jgi:3-deoxy-7-phosphoheptulonate synthase
MYKARAFLLQLAELGLAAGTEALDPISPQYLGDLISWTAIGARTTESQTHREISSGLSTPVGFKNGTNGDVGIAVNAILSASRPHSFLGINGQGRTSIVRTRGNRYGHLVLRGGDGRPNYDTVSVQMAEQALRKAGLPTNIVVDCSHANSYKKARVAAAGHGRRGQSGPPRKPVSGRHDDRVQYRCRQPVNPGRSLAAQVRLLGDRRLR